MTVNFVLDHCEGSEAIQSSGRLKPNIRFIVKHGFSPRKFLFIIFVDVKFTTSFQRPFTNVSDVTGAICADDCVCHARHAD